jgi:thiosulfate reductase cytochrome b subunit
MKRLINYSIKFVYFFKKIPIFIVFFFLTSLFMGVNSDSKKLHPKISFYDRNGNVLRTGFSNHSSEKTCSTCHDVKYILKDNSHSKHLKEMNCLNCHLDRGNVKGSFDKVLDEPTLTSDNIKIINPKNENCNSCHGTNSYDDQSIELPKDFLHHEKYNSIKFTGVIQSYQKIKDSFLNIQNKSNSENSWDVHSERKVSCTGCHFTSNNPKKNINRPEKDSDHLISDPRSLSQSDYLNRPNHDLTNLDCQTCHNPYKIHSEIPYKATHIEKLQCQSCHVPIVKGPILKEIDFTILKAPSTPAQIFRNLEGKDEDPINARYIKSFTPSLLPLSDSEKLAPMNLVTRWNWISTGTNIPMEKLNEVFFPEASDKKNELLSIFDSNQNNKIDEEEFQLNTEQKYNFIKNKFKDLGYSNPEIRGVISLNTINHGIQRGELVTKDCLTCHSVNAPILNSTHISSLYPGRSLPEFDQKALHLGKVGKLKLENDSIIYEKELQKAKFYIFGTNQWNWSDVIGMLFFVSTIIIVSVHIGFRIYYMPKHNPESHKHLKVVYMYSFYERLWHWTSAFGIIFLMITGMAVHFPNYLPFIDLRFSVYTHNILAFILIVNAFLSLFYHLVSSEIKQFLPPMKSFWQDSIVQFRYYTHGIFHGEPHPIEKARNKKLNPLQQLTYLAILNILLPIQVITGIMMWASGKYPGLMDSIGGLKTLGPIHNLCSWLFLSFLFLHVYLTTTGRTWFSNVHSMVVGFDRLESHNPKE